MKAPKNSTFQDRQATAAAAKAAMLERFRARPGPDDPAVIERRAAQAAIDAAREVRAQERKLAKEAEAARKAAEQAARAEELKAAALADEARVAEEAARAAQRAIEQKAARDQRYAARQARRR